MTDIIQGFELSILTWPEVIIRTLLAAILGLVIGIERGIKNKPVDFRVFIIVCSSSCLIAILSQEIYADYARADNVIKVDLGKIIAGVLTGIGFLGAGAIIKRENDEVVGSATGASIWASGGTGLALGFGFYGLAFITFLIVAIILFVGGYFQPAVQGRADNGKGSGEEKE